MIVSIVALEAFRHDFTVSRGGVRSRRKAKVKISWVQNWEAPSFAKNAKDGPPARAKPILSAMGIFRQLCATVRSETPNAFTIFIWRPANSELSAGGGGLWLEPLANHQREPWE